MKKHVQTVLLFILVGMFLLGATSCSLLTGSAENNTPTATPDPNATLPPQQVVDAAYSLYEKEDFSIQYHEKWMVKKNLSNDETIDLDKSEVAFTIPEGMKVSETDTGRVYPMLTVFKFKIEEDQVENFDLETYVSDQVKYLEIKLYQFTLLQEVTQVQIGDKTAFSISYIGSVHNTNEVRVKQTFLTNGTNVYVITYGADADFYKNENYLKIADKMTQSFVLK